MLFSVVSYRTCNAINIAYIIVLSFPLKVKKYMQETFSQSEKQFQPLSHPPITNAV